MELQFKSLIKLPLGLLKDVQRAMKDVVLARTLSAITLRISILEEVPTVLSQEFHLTSNQTNKLKSNELKRPL
jgi:hypothetical protein